MSPSVARHPHALYFDIPNAEKLSIPQQHFFIIDGHLRQLIEMINDLPAHFPGQVAVFGLAYMSLADIFFLFLDILLLVLFGTALSSIINFFLSTQGQISAVGTIISAGYGFICGAYMPISSFGEGLQKIISFLPGTYGTSLIRNHTMQGALAEMQNQGIPTEVIEKLKDSLDCNLYFFGSQVNIGTMYMILGITILVLIGIYILLNKSKKYNC